MFGHKKAMIQIESIIGALLAIRPGQSVIYFVGFLDKERGGTLAKPAMLAAKLANEGRVYLTQRRLGSPTHNGEVNWQNGIGPGFEYIATGSLKSEAWYGQTRTRNT